MGRQHLIRQSFDGGATFQGSSITTDSRDRVHEIEQSRSDPDTYYFVQTDMDTTSKGKDTILGRRIIRTINGGQSFGILSAFPSHDKPYHISLAIDPSDKEKIYASVRKPFLSNDKVYYSHDAGVTWQPWGSPELNNKFVNSITFQGGTNGGVYLITNFGIYYRNLSMSKWELFTEGLPAQIEPHLLQPFYKEGKLRMATFNRGIWEIPFYEESAPLAQPSVDRKTGDSKTVFQFEDYSILNHDDATWSWSFSPEPKYVSSKTARNPQVIFGCPGDHHVTLTVTQNGQSHTKTVANMITIDDPIHVFQGTAGEYDLNDSDGFWTNGDFTPLSRYTITVPNVTVYVDSPVEMQRLNIGPESTFRVDETGELHISTSCSSESTVEINGQLINFGTIVIDSAGIDGIKNNGSIINYGSIIIKNTNDDAIEIRGTIENYGTIKVTDCPFGLYLPTAASSIVNEGRIDIGSLPTGISMNHVDATFTNEYCGYVSSISPWSLSFGSFINNGYVGYRDLSSNQIPVTNYTENAMQFDPDNLLPDGGGILVSNHIDYKRGIVHQFSDDYEGSFRHSIVCAVANDTLQFQEALPQVELTTGEILIDKNLTIIGEENGSSIVDGISTPNKRILKITGDELKVNIHKPTFSNDGGDKTAATVLW